MYLSLKLLITKLRIAIEIPRFVRPRVARVKVDTFHITSLIKSKGVIMSFAPFVRLELLYIITGRVVFEIQRL